MTRRAADDRPRRLADDRVAHAGRDSRSSAAPTSPRATAIAGAGTGFLTHAAASCGRCSAEAGATAASSRRAAVGQHASSRALGARGAPGGVPGRRALPTPSRRPGTRRSTRRTAASARAPKFPRPSTLELLLRYHRRTGDRQSARHASRRRSRSMAAGGMYDHVGGGFHRYSTDARWLVPHFEKMLYDNAQLAVRSTSRRYQLTGRRRLRARGPRDARLRRPRDDVAGRRRSTRRPTPTASRPRATPRKAGSSPGRLPRFAAVLGAENVARVVATYYGVTEGGNFERPQHPPYTAPRSPGSPRSSVYAPRRAPDHDRRSARRAFAPSARGGRPPLRDDKIIAAWNGLMISAFARGALVLERNDYRDGRASRRRLRPRRACGAPTAACGGHHKDGRARHRGVLDDYAFVVQALLDSLRGDRRDPLDRRRVRAAALRRREFFRY